MVTQRLDETVQRRLRAGRLLLTVKTPAEAARAAGVGVGVGVGRQTAYPCRKLLDEGGIDAPPAMPLRGRPARPDEQQLLRADARPSGHRARGRGGADLEAQDLAWAPEKARRDNRLIIFSGESGLSERSTQIRTRAPKAKTPISQFHFNWTHISIIAGLKDPVGLG